MSAPLERPTSTELTTASVPDRDAFAYWRDIICATFVRLAADPTGDARFEGRIEHVPAGDIEMSVVTSRGHLVRRTRAMIARHHEEYLLASIQLRGFGLVEQDGRTAPLSAGDMAFYDSTRPYALRFDAPFRQLVVRVPRARVLLRDTRNLTARALGRTGPGEVVPAFFTALTRAERDDPGGSRALLPHALGLLSTAAAHANGSAPGREGVEALIRQRVSEYLRRHACDPRVDADRVAAACGVSRRTLYRIVGDEGVASALRRIRIEQAQALLLDDPTRPIGAVASACGFSSESGFFRAFRAVTGRTPGEYRETAGTRGE